MRRLYLLNELRDVSLHMIARRNEQRKYAKLGAAAFDEISATLNEVGFNHLQETGSHWSAKSLGQLGAECPVCVVRSLVSTSMCDQHDA